MVFLLGLLVVFGFLVDFVQSARLCDDFTLILICFALLFVVVLMVAAVELVADASSPKRYVKSSGPIAGESPRAARENQRDADKRQPAGYESQWGGRSQPAVDPADVTKAEVARDLGLHPGMSDLEIKGARRRYALLNHPDKLPQEQRPEAEHRMQIANNLADKALRRTVSC